MLNLIEQKSSGSCEKILFFCTFDFFFLCYINNDDEEGDDKDDVC